MRARSFAPLVRSRRDASRRVLPDLRETLGVLGTTSQDLGAAADVMGKISRWPRSTKRGVARRSQGRRGTLHDAGRRR
jgi:hypothetical protein